MAIGFNFTSLWERLKNSAEVTGNEKLKATLLNHERKKEYICRKLGVVTDADVNRVSGRISKSKETQNKSK